MTRKTVQIHVSIPEDLKMKADLVALANKTSLTQVVRRALEEHLTETKVAIAMSALGGKVKARVR